MEENNIDGIDFVYENNKSSFRKRCDSARNKRSRYLLAVLENPKNVNNIGGIIRSIDSLGISKLYIVGKPIEGKRNEKLLNSSSTGSSKHVYIRYFESTEKCIEHLLYRGYTSLVTSPHQKGKNNIPLMEGKYEKYPKLAVWFGNETLGISEEAIELSQGCINIDMAGINESLNLSVSAGIILQNVSSMRRRPDNQKYMREIVQRRKGRTI